ncbi:YjhX family toxin [Mycoplana sp. MJR14]|uniref:YjhX family toxin n=1 Tax=Mycoplana sp. MJR14 TaxID=3032583 RepID=UPI0011DFCE88|nr:YjhX family toxin [Mycoplana sp. MJR14]MDF1634843.1 YjhX family toxin [Mycoplana sp. MJR14]
MDISRAEQRILHLLAQGGRIELERDETRTILNVHCITRDGWRAGGLDLDLFRKLKRRKCIASQGGRPYRITHRGLVLVRSQLDNR